MYASEDGRKHFQTRHPLDREEENDIRNQPVVKQQGLVSERAKADCIFIKSDVSCI